VSGAAFAQSNVTVYGRADVGYVYSKSDFRKFQGIESGVGQGGGPGYGGPSRIGFRGEEGLGNGLKAIFNFEWGLAADEGSGPATPRWTYVGLAGKFGTVTVGRNRTPTDLWDGTAAANGLNTLDAGALLRGNLNTHGDDSVVTGRRWNNSIAYTSPNFSGVQLAAIYSFGEKVNGTKNADGSYSTATCGNNGATPAVNYTCKGADTSDAGKLGLGVRYANGPLNVFAAYEAHADDDSVKRNSYPVGFAGVKAGYGIKGYTIGGGYDFKVVKVYANYARAKANHDGQAIAANSGSDKQTFWSLGAIIPVSTPGAVTLEYGQYKDYLNGVRAYTAARSVGGLAAGQTSGHKAKGYTVGYNHNLSKRTAVYAFATYIDNDKGVGAGWAKTGVVGEKQTIFATGIAHNF
jgi:predicted porin